MIVLGIETSCDETAVAIVSDDKKVLSHLVLTQLDQHKVFGGVVPEIASRSHIDCLDGLVKQAVSQAGITLDKIDAIAATAGPGLIGGVLVGTMLAKGLALALNKPFIAVNHLEGHALTIRLTEDIAFPYLLLLVSGGHCQILIATEVGQYTVIGQTLDDAVGEAFDKAAKMLGLDYPGGPEIEQRAKLGNAYRFDLPKPMMRQSKYDFSFSGLKTAVKLLIDTQKAKREFSELDKNDICASLQHTIAEILVNRITNAASYYVDKYQNGRTLVIAGGVAANRYLHQKISESLEPKGFKVVAPPLELCTDNGAMIAWAGVERLRLELIDDLSFAPRSRWPLEELTERVR